MPFTLEQLRQARKNAEDAGDSSAAQMIHQAIIQQVSASYPKADPTADMGTGDRLMSGVGQGMTNVYRHAGNLLNIKTDQEMQDAKQLDAPLLKTGAGRFGSMIGETAITAPMMMGGAGIVARGGAAAARAVANPVSRGALEGVAQGSLMADHGERGSGAFLGGALGSALPFVGSGFGKLVRGLNRTPEAQALLNQGVDITPGQMNPNGLINQIEESWLSVPGVGSVVKGARDNAQNSFQRVATESAAAPGTRIAAGSATKMLDDAYKSFEPLYEQARGFTEVVPSIVRESENIPLFAALKKSVSSKSTVASDQARDRAWSIIKREWSKGTKGSDRLLDMRSELRRSAREARKSTETLQHDTADILDSAEQRITDALDSQLPPDAMQAVRTADAQYGMYKVIEDAVAAAKDKPGGFTAADLSRAVASAMKGETKGVYARGGGGVLRDLASAGTEVMNSRSPATGARLAAIAAPLGLGAAAPAVGIPVAAAMLALTGTRTGRRLAAGATSPQVRLQQLLNQYKSTTGPLPGILDQYAKRALVSGGLFSQ
jgi:hypothetical protein